MNQFEANRNRLVGILKGGVAVFAAHDAMQQTADMAAPFIQESTFWWLTGIDEPGWKVIIDSARNHATLVRPQRSRMQQIFDGETPDEIILASSGANDIIDAADFEQSLRNIARKHPLVYTVYDKTPHEFVINPAQRALHDTLTRIFTNVEDFAKQINELRAIKSDDEIKMMKKAINLTIDAFEHIRSNLNDFKYEYEIDAEFTYQFRRKNAEHAYQPIVAAGSHAVTLHFIANDARISAKDAVLIDIGARVNGYCADVTRTYACNPTKRQRQVHAALQRAQQRIISLLKPDQLVKEYIEQVDEIMKDSLQEIGLLNDRTDTETYRRYFPHAVSHGLGVDVHDSLGAPNAFKPGMVLTVEPGIYIPEESLGMRIEDDILITETGPTNLSGRLSTEL